MNATTCGVARFNSLLAERFGVPLLNVFDDLALEHESPLLSIKIEELAPADLIALGERLDRLVEGRSLAIFLHTLTDAPLEREMLRRAAAVYCGNAEIHALVKPLRPDAIELWCPGMIRSEDRFQPVDLSVFTFGMAHKIRSDAYVRLHRLLDQSGRSYALYLSTALHENTSLDDTFGEAFVELRALFGERVHFLGFLSDAAVYNHLLDSTYFAAFFPTGVRANNTSVNAAMAAGAVVITNLDAYSPPALRHAHNVLDIDRLGALPVEAGTLAALGARARETAGAQLGWPSLVARFSAHEAERGRTALPTPRS
jgi:hypothetical protein